MVLQAVRVSGCHGLAAVAVQSKAQMITSADCCHCAWEVLSTHVWLITAILTDTFSHLHPCRSNYNFATENEPPPIAEKDAL